MLCTPNFVVHSSKSFNPSMIDVHFSIILFVRCSICRCCTRVVSHVVELYSYWAKTKSCGKVLEFAWIPTRCIIIVGLFKMFRKNFNCSLLCSIVSLNVAILAVYSLTTSPVFIKNVSFLLNSFVKKSKTNCPFERLANYIAKMDTEVRVVARAVRAKTLDGFYYKNGLSQLAFLVMITNHHKKAN